MKVKSNKIIWKKRDIKAKAKPTVFQLSKAKLEEALKKNITNYDRSNGGLPGSMFDKLRKVQDNSKVCVNGSVQSKLCFSGANNVLKFIPKSMANAI